jgi:hypothetical protein
MSIGFGATAALGVAQQRSWEAIVELEGRETATSKEREEKEEEGNVAIMKVKTEGEERRSYSTPTASA